jgi:hypothetical protein
MCGSVAVSGPLPASPCLLLGGVVRPHMCGVASHLLLGQSELLACVLACSVFCATTLVLAFAVDRHKTASGRLELHGCVNECPPHTRGSLQPLRTQQTAAA